MFIYAFFSFKRNVQRKKYELLFNVYILILQIHRVFFSFIEKFKKDDCLCISFSVKPAVSIVVFINSGVRKKEKSIIVKRDQHMILICMENTNTSGDVEMFTWFYNGNVLQNNTNMMVFNKTDPVMSGLYTCAAMNEAGKDSDAVFITVTCKYKYILCLYTLHDLCIMLK